jgi:hypothetical protein
MREDMSKVVIERPRWGHSLPSMKTGLRLRRYDPGDEYEDFPKRAPASRGRQKNGGKSFSDLLGPLRRYLRSNVGRPWDKVYSEMKQHLDSRKTTGQHIFEHVKWEVALDCYIGKDGKVYQYSNQWHQHPVEGLYVHPRTKLLCWKEPQRYRHRQAQKEKTRIPISGNRSYIKLKGIWYIAELEETDKRQMPQAGDILKEAFEEGYRKWWILRKNQCSSKQLKAAGLSNTPAE